MEIIFKNPIYLWALIAIPISIFIHFLTLKYAKGLAIEFGNFPTLAKIARTPIFTRDFILLLLHTLIIALIVLAVSGTTFQYMGLKGSSNYVLAIDTSSSMLSDDFNPNRLEAAKETALDFINTLTSGEKIGIVSFAGTSFIKQQLTSDKLKIREAINNIQAESVSGTDIGEAIVTSTNLLLSDVGNKVIILLTDGRSNIGIPISDALNYANQNTVTIHSIGIGTEEGGIFTDIKETLKLDEEALKLISNTTGGNFYRATNKQQLANAYSEISSKKEQKISFDLTPYLILASLALIIINWVLMNTKFRRIP